MPPPRLKLDDIDFHLVENGPVTGLEFKIIFGRKPNTPQDLARAIEVLGPRDPYSQGFPEAEGRFDTFLGEVKDAFPAGRGGPWESAALYDAIKDHTLNCNAHDRRAA